MHTWTEENAKKAKEVDLIIRDLHAHSEKQWNGMVKLNSELSAFPELIEAMDKVMENLGMQLIYGLSLAIGKR